MIEEIKLNELNQWVERLSREELVWLNGYVSGILKNSLREGTKNVALQGKVTIVYGTETGNSKKLATEFVSKARKQGLQAKLSGLDQYRLSDLAKEENLVVVISTHGDGEPPAAAKKFFNHIFESELALSRLRYGVLALGDTAYPLFCKAGEEVDTRLENLGGKRILPLQKCDVEYQESAEEWFQELVRSFSTNRIELGVQTRTQNKIGRRVYNGKLLSKVNLNATGSLKETYHFEIAADDLIYEPGDAVGIIPKNSIKEVERIIQLLGITEDQIISYKEKEYQLVDLLTDKLSISYLSDRVVKKYATIVQQNIPGVRLDLIDLLKIYPPSSEKQVAEIIQSLEPIVPRLYSISSSPKVHEGEVHLTVTRNCFHIDGVTRRGLCSDYLARLEEETSIEFYVHKNLQFKLPAGDKDILMIGPGTGIAPFRAFVEERVSTGATGRSWLFFGDQHFHSDFLYQTEWQDYLKTGGLTKMNVAFSRDQQEKVYVQHKLLQHATEIYEWIEGGAHLYVCGAKSMSADVENILLEIIGVDGKKSEEEAQLYLNRLAEDGRYVKDVY
ncbi:MAG TPA: flavodoxin domain-containing protein [Cyclobacteriaceae bacterium]|jgi:sulfite reductase (NADPH) flavoprotein alpha-component|nr:flavodoxin domain-containing protein [Cyclobacteriaceae bacterium]